MHNINEAIGVMFTLNCFQVAGGQSGNCDEGWASYSLQYPIPSEKYCTLNIGNPCNWHFLVSVSIGNPICLFAVQISRDTNEEI